MDSHLDLNYILVGADNLFLLNLVTMIQLVYDLRHLIWEENPGPFSSVDSPGSSILWKVCSLSVIFTTLRSSFDQSW
jgi:hypothetical protein